MPSCEDMPRFIVFECSYRGAFLALLLEIYENIDKALFRSTIHRIQGVSKRLSKSSTCRGRWYRGQIPPNIVSFETNLAFNQDLDDTL